MSGNRPRILRDLLQSGDMARLRGEALARRELTAKIRALLPESEASHLVRAGWDSDGALVLTMDSSAWAAKVRFRAEALGPRKIRVRVRPADEP